jgi:glucose-1-phosphate cytidylyltransferase
MKIFEAQGFNDFIICVGYKSYVIKEYFLNYYVYNSDVTINLSTNSFEVHRSNTEKFRVTIVDTGVNTGTAGRLKRAQHHIGNEEFLLTYGDGVADVDLKQLIAHHHEHGKIGTVTAVQPEGRFGLLDIESDSHVKYFNEKLSGDGGWINGGFFVLKPEIFNYLPDNADQLMWEDYPLEKLTEDKQLSAYKHKGFWKCMDAIRDKFVLEQLWSSGQAKWKIWD